MLHAIVKKPWQTICYIFLKSRVQTQSASLETLLQEDNNHIVPPPLFFINAVSYLTSSRNIVTLG